ncbi:MAG TPA: ThuA domain-containing protein [Gemmatimonadaceae bacterium]|nr:ThuA domain-containing protein [Gemmatimonadaceae bacterium]
MPATRHRLPVRTLSTAALLFSASALSAQQSPQSPAAGAAAAPASAGTCTLARPRAGTRVLVFSRTKGFRHASIPDGVAAVTALGARHGFDVESTEDPTVFTDQSLRRFAAVVFMMTTGDVLDDAQQAAFERYIRAGRGFVGVHSATDTEYDWAWYGQLVGAYFKSHPRVQEARLDVRDRTHLSTKCLPEVWTRRDEWYDFRAAPPAEVKVLITIDEKSYSGGQMGAVHPMAWYRVFQGGRTIYSEMGHTHESWKEQAYLDHLAGAILWATGRD